MTIPLAELIGIAVCLVLSAFFSSAETALSSLGRARIETLIHEQTSVAKYLQVWIDKPREILTTILIGNNIVNTLASALATSAVEQMLAHIQSDSRWLSPIPIAVGVMTFLLLTFGEISPKVLARSYRETIAVRAMFVLRPMHFLFQPVVYGFVKLTETIMKLLGQPPIPRTHVTDDELEFLVHLGGQEGSISKDKLALFESIFDVTDTDARAIMVPRIDLVSVAVDIELSELLQILLDAAHSRMPVYDGSKDEIIGIVHVKDIFGALYGPNGAEQFNLRDLLREAHFVPETKGILPLLREMQAHRNHMAMVVDEFGGISGLVTLEDIIEEFFGEIWDEHDRRTEVGIRAIAPNAYRVRARIPFNDLARLFDTDLPEDHDYDTVGGFIAKETGVVATVGTVVERWGIRFTVLDADPRHVRRVRIEKLPDDEHSADRKEENGTQSGSES